MTKQIEHKQIKHENIKQIEWGRFKNTLLYSPIMNYRS